MTDTSNPASWDTWEEVLSDALYSFDAAVSDQLIAIHGPAGDAITSTARLIAERLVEAQSPDRVRQLAREAASVLEPASADRTRRCLCAITTNRLIRYAARRAADLSGDSAP
jgi:hypothetical protein